MAVNTAVNYNEDLDNTPAQSNEVLAPIILSDTETRALSDVKENGGAHRALAKILPFDRGGVATRLGGVMSRVPGLKELVDEDALRLGERKIDREETVAALDGAHEYEHEVFGRINALDDMFLAIEKLDIGVDLGLMKNRLDQIGSSFQITVNARTELPNELILSQTLNFASQKATEQLAALEKDLALHINQMIERRVTNIQKTMNCGICSNTSIRKLSKQLKLLNTANSNLNPPNSITLKEALQECNKTDLLLIEEIRDLDVGHIDTEPFQSTDLPQRWQALQSSLKSVTTATEALDAINQVKELRNESLDMLSSQISTAYEAYDTFVSQVDQTVRFSRRKDSGRTKRRIKSLQTKIDNTKREGGDLRSIIKTSKEELQYIANRLKELDEIVSDLKKNADLLRPALANMGQEAGELVAQIDRLHANGIQNVDDAKLLITLQRKFEVIKLRYQQEGLDSLTGLTEKTMKESIPEMEGEMRTNFNTAYTKISEKLNEAKKAGLISDDYIQRFNEGYLKCTSSKAKTDYLKREKDKLIESLKTNAKSRTISVNGRNVTIHNIAEFSDTVKKEAGDYRTTVIEPEAKKEIEALYRERLESFDQQIIDFNTRTQAEIDKRIADRNQQIQALKLQAVQTSPLIIGTNAQSSSTAINKQQIELQIANLEAQTDQIIGTAVRNEAAFHTASVKNQKDLLEKQMKKEIEEKANTAYGQLFIVEVSEGVYECSKIQPANGTFFTLKEAEIIKNDIVLGSQKAKSDITKANEIGKEIDTQITMMSGLQDSHEKVNISNLSEVTAKQKTVLSLMTQIRSLRGKDMKKANKLFTELQAARSEVNAAILKSCNGDKAKAAELVKNLETEMNSQSKQAMHIAHDLIKNLKDAGQNSKDAYWHAGLRKNWSFGQDYGSMYTKTRTDLMKLREKMFFQTEGWTDFEMTTLRRDIDEVIAHDKPRIIWSLRMPTIFTGERRREDRMEETLKRAMLGKTLDTDAIGFINRISTTLIKRRIWYRPLSKKIELIQNAITANTTALADSTITAEAKVNLELRAQKLEQRLQKLKIEETKKTDVLIHAGILKTKRSRPLAWPIMAIRESFSGLGEIFDTILNKPEDGFGAYA